MYIFRIIGMSTDKKHDIESFVRAYSESEADVLSERALSKEHNESWHVRRDISRMGDAFLGKPRVLSLLKKKHFRVEEQ